MTHQRRAGMIVLCEYCGAPAALVEGRDIYQGPNRDRRFLSKPFWACLPCKAWVGCHPDTEIPLGRLADEQLRRAKMAAHAAFDPLWKHKVVAPELTQQRNRPLAYKWLADALRIPVDDCHIGMFDLATCKRVVAVCRARDTRAAA